MSNANQESTHGIAIGIERVGEQVFIAIRAVGKLSHQDYEVMTPMFEAALKEVPYAKVDVLADLTEFHGWELRAAWDDFKLGLKHGAQFNKIALVGHQQWQSVAASVGSWFVDGEIKAFDDHQQALVWLSQ
ncbi:STAS/SEC14 domain-containing protein [Motilimonas eburnea]|uniref:STAS/SEC14 domain-containing protein n=1 Tax=Motilimonas eburnea TaxID=1737488 RepID=UPI001E2DFAD6|nr:STAS/SEC14 domain-containing protein [Motilimonas eburnea]MCE2570249.1 STAS/SEC14 domain-containing protein [Motilimonas eburnea]